MSKSRGEGRSSAEKAQTVITPYSVRKARAEKLRKEEEEWASKSGPVEVRKKVTDEGAAPSPG